MFRRLLVGAVVLGLLVLLGASITTAVLVAGEQESTRWVNHTYEVERDLSELRVAFERAEAARRGFLATRDDSYLAIYREVATRLPALIEQIQATTADNPAQQQAVARLTPLLARKLNEQDSSMQAAPREGGASNPAVAIREDQGLVDQIRSVVAGMVEEERRLLESRTDRQSADAETLLLVVLGSGVAVALLALGSFVLMRRYAADLDRSERALRTLNAGLESEVTRRTADLTRANEEIQRFAYIVSHDLRSPLVNVMGFTSELELAVTPLQALIARLEAEAPQLLDADAREAVRLDLPESIGFIRGSTQKMDRLINAILKLSREGRRTLSPEPIDMAEMLEGVAGSLKQQTEQRGATIVLEQPLPNLTGDRLATEQVFSNVVENALKYLKPGRPGEIVVRGRRDGDRLVYEVQDNGRGIDPKDHERVFELFRRAGPQDQAGEGIGLAHVRALVQRLGGSIAVDSELDRGATFSISLPSKLISTEDRQ